MASQTSVLQHTWSSRCYLAHSAIEAALANFGAGRASDLVPVEIYLREIVSLYDQSDGMDKDQLRAWPCKSRTFRKR